MRVVFGEESLAEDQHWNIVQNNGIISFPSSSSTPFNRS